MDFLKQASRELKKELKRKLKKSDKNSAARDLPGDEYDAKAAEAIQGEIIMFSGCKDSQTSADVHDVSSFGLPDADGAGGACTHALLRAVQDGNESYADVLKAMRETLRGKKFTQVPQLSASRRIDMRQALDVAPRDGGKCKALLVGINYVGQRGELAGCWHDVEAITDFLSERGFEADAVTTLLDDGDHDAPTGPGILKAIAELLDGAEPGDSLWFSYSGHGGSVADDDGDEADGADETLVPVDYQENGQIRDDDLFARLVANVPAGVKLTVLIDACHSGTVLDLPYSFNATDDALTRVQDNPEEASFLGPNSAFDFQKLLAIAKTVFTMHMAGAPPDQIFSAVKGQFGF
mmetsp:Transcript_18680/g.60391  ORF Transcript_18680/g.60391 Transcript_18680/m.60391 type:complete len:351 (-) Transcript_18680:118-1170(-)